MISLDSKTAKRFVKGSLQEVDATLTDRIDNFSTKSKSFEKLGKRKSQLEKNIALVFGPCMLTTFWEGRILYCVGLEPIAPTDDSNRPYHGMLRFVMYNSRSDNTNDADVVEVTTHAMERMLERRSNVNILTVLKEELTWKFVTNLTDVFSKVSKSQRTEVKVKTTNGWACLIFEPNTIPVMTTWY